MPETEKQQPTIATGSCCVKALCHSNNYRKTNPTEVAKREGWSTADLENCAKFQSG
ncbi:MAG: hypothetical protein NWE93_04205 [Candidatus Bathyarchaeota archaeon]|nr:hypothetical protein [Candidatus Bathyarchaeota archaeon]